MKRPVGATLPRAGRRADRGLWIRPRVAVWDIRPRAPRRPPAGGGAAGATKLLAVQRGPREVQPVRAAADMGMGVGSAAAKRYSRPIGPRPTAYGSPRGRGTLVPPPGAENSCRPEKTVVGAARARGVEMRRVFSQPAAAGGGWGSEGIRPPARDPTPPSRGSVSGFRKRVLPDAGRPPRRLRTPPHWRFSPE